MAKQWFIINEDGTQTRKVGQIDWSTYHSDPDPDPEEVDTDETEEVDSETPPDKINGGKNAELLRIANELGVKL